MMPNIFASRHADADFAAEGAAATMPPLHYAMRRC